VEVSNQELKIISRSYLKYCNEWMAIRTDIRKQVDILLPVCRNLYESGQFDKVKRMMSNKIEKKSGNDGYVLKCEIRSMVTEIKHRNQSCSSEKIFGLVYGVYRHFQQYFSYIMAVIFIGGGHRSNREKPPTCR